ncbi:MAG: XdhC family protein [Spirochaetaceae bacterium]|nr:MAG: XdhC family protein [Spirochaetaceae bacterium]
MPESEAARATIFDRDDGRCFGYLLAPAPRLVIVGASHLGQELAAAAMRVGFQVCMVDTRPRFLTEERFPTVAERLVTTPRKAFDALGVGAETAVCAISHDDKLDDAAITLALERGCYYVGALGSRLTHAERCERLSEQGVAPQRLEEVRSPIGISIGATTPAEIALSIAAEVSGAYRLLVPKRR